MDKPESLEEFYERKFNWLPEDLKKDMGHFNIFRLEPYWEGKVKAIPYRRRDFYKVMLVQGQSQVHYADRVYEVKKQALSFSNPMVPYKWDSNQGSLKGVYCIFNPRFFVDFPDIQKYEVFQPQGTHVFELTHQEVAMVTQIFERIDTLEKAEILENRYKETADFYRIYLFWAMIFMLAWLGLKSSFLNNFLLD